MRLSEVTKTDFRPPFGELDIVGMVAYIGSSLPGNSGFQTVYLADTDFNILGLAFWGGVKVLVSWNLSCLYWRQRSIKGFHFSYLH